MREKYGEIMEKVIVTDEMRSRILQAVQNADVKPAAKVLRFPRWQRVAAAAACFALVLIGALTLPGILRPSQGNPAGSATDRDAPVIGAQETVECPSAAELSREIGFPVSDVAALPFAPTGAVYLSLFGEIAEIDYTGAEGQSAAYRKSAGTDDNSGNYETFTDTEQLSVGGVRAAVKGDGTRFTLAVWTDGTYSYSIALSDGVGLDEWETLLGGAF